MPRNKSMDFDKPYGTVRSTKPNDPVKYLQGDSYYDHDGNFVRLVDPNAAPKPKTAPVPQAVKRKTEADLKREALAAAADKLGLDTIPQELKDAARENAEALAAEDNA
jgi:hypothetical protein